MCTVRACIGERAPKGLARNYGRRMVLLYRFNGAKFFVVVVSAFRSRIASCELSIALQVAPMRIGWRSIFALK